MPKVTEAIHNFVLARRATHNGPDLLDRIMARPGIWKSRSTWPLTTGSR